MKQSEKTRNSLITHYNKYPNLQIQDIFKFIYQSSFGCEHMVSSLKTATDYIYEEFNTLKSTDSSTEALDGEYSRVHLGYMEFGLSAETLGRLFFESAKKEPDGKVALENKLSITRELIVEKRLPFSVNEFEKAVENWKAEGYPSVHHSDIFRNKYKPSYRVIANKYVTFLPLFTKLDEMLKQGTTLVAIEGGSASGKTTLGEILKSIYDCTVLHTDDFFLRPEQRTPERYAQIGGNIDRERFTEEVLIPLSKGEDIQYRKFDCSVMAIMPSVTIKQKKLVVVEGAYSMHPEFEKYYDFSAFLDISPQLQKQRIEKRNSPEFAKRFFDQWIPLEQRYFSSTQVEKRCNLVIKI